jgi:hypothetical protein
MGQAPPRDPHATVATLELAVQYYRGFSLLLSIPMLQSTKSTVRSRTHVLQSTKQAIRSLFQCRMVKTQNSLDS